MLLFRGAVERAEWINVNSVSAVILQAQTKPESKDQKNLVERPTLAPSLALRGALTAKIRDVVRMLQHRL
jgi:hypothetical protein